VEKPGNLGAILRTADAVGCDAVVVCDPVVDLFNPNVVRSATAVLFSLPVATASPDQVLSWLRDNKLLIVATTPDTDLLYWDANMRGPTAVLMGAEDDGLTQRWINDADVLVRLPMAGQADSLNVGAATAVVLYEAVRQRFV
jgi:RNA methyltransferase, TrmH family